MAFLGELSLLFHVATGQASRMCVYNDMSTPNLCFLDTSGPIKFLPSEQNIDTGVQSKLLDTREKYSELWHDCAFLPRGLGRGGENSEVGAEMRGAKRNCCPYGEWPSAEAPLQPLGPLWHPNSLRHILPFSVKPLWGGGGSVTWKQQSPNYFKHLLICVTH